MNLQLIEIDSPAFNQMMSKVVQEATATALREAERLFGKKTQLADWVGAEEARKILGCGKSKLQELRDNESITFTEGRKPRYKTSSLLAYLEKQSK